MVLFLGIIIIFFLTGIAICCCIVSGYIDNDLEEYYVKTIIDLEKENEMLELMLYEMTMELEDENNSK